jgi:hypothetical protein
MPVNMNAALPGTLPVTAGASHAPIPTAAAWLVGAVTSSPVRGLPGRELPWVVISVANALTVATRPGAAAAISPYAASMRWNAPDQEPDWPPSWFSSIRSERTDTADRTEEILRAELGRDDHR